MVLPNLDIAIVFIVIVVSAILTAFGKMEYGDTSSLFLLFSTIWGMFSLGYLITNYSAIIIGTFIFPIWVFAVAYLFLGILVPLVLMIDRVM